MDDVHGAHCTAGIVKNPFLLLVHVLAGNLLVQLCDNVVDDAAGVVPMSCNGTLREIMQVAGLEDVELLQARIKEGVEGREKGQEDGQETERAHREAATAGLFGVCGLRMRLGHGGRNILLRERGKKEEEEEEEKS